MSSYDEEFADHFGIDNIPFGIASSTWHDSLQAVTRYDNTVIFLAELSITGVPQNVFLQSSLNSFAALGRAIHSLVRSQIQQLIREEKIPGHAKEHVTNVCMALPVVIGDFTDFSCSPTHNRNAGQALMGQARGLPPGYLHMPLGYAGRCSSISVSGTPIHRPRGLYFEHGIEGLQGKRTQVTCGPSRDLDYELEMGVIIGKPVPYGDFLSAKQASQHIFGFILINDWSARDIQQLEMIPVGPLNSKHGATTISAWVISPDALESFKVDRRHIERGQLAPHLLDPKNKVISVDVQTSVISGDISQRHKSVMCTTNVREMDWTFEQIIAHQSSSGCGMRSGDLLGIGTISGPGTHESGCMLEEFVPGSTPRRHYIADNEEVQLVGKCGPGVGFGQCLAKVTPSKDKSAWP
ncbi:fumarylacetoacetate hydrolase FahA [Myriangium duriaei CBS 260.36]|uniref:Fumarylacetoacetase n=1 Tax=Myriangium duriaei CBS 260.36 TaxID=1168546 RepID=A0A9P4MK75_9PEZI|nr:fumarylacetoacetate hydrolase FahA [Myriangium duriaei CBS 260.36]